MKFELSMLSTKTLEVNTKTYFYSNFEYVNEK